MEELQNARRTNPGELAALRAGLVDVAEGEAGSIVGREVRIKIGSNITRLVHWIGEGDPNAQVLRWV